MNEQPEIAILAMVDSAERPGILAGAERLRTALRSVAGESWRVRIEFAPPGAQIQDPEKWAAIIVSLLSEAHRVSEPFDRVEANWRRQFAQLKLSGVPLFVCTVYRRIPRTGDGPISTPVLERIRRLNRLAVDLSHNFDSSVIDIDRAFAFLGGRTLKADYRLSGKLAAEIVGHTMAWSLLSGGLDAIVDPELQENAKSNLGSLRKIGALINRQLKQRRGMHAPDRQAAGGQ